MKSLVLAWALASVAFAAPASAGCDEFWKKQRRLKEHDIQLETNPRVPDLSEPIEGFVVKMFTRENGRPVIPETLAESDCYLQRAIPRNLAEAIRLGAQDASRSLSKQPDSDDLQALSEGINARLEQALGGVPGARFGFSTLAIHVSDAYQFRLWDVDAYTRLQRELSKRGTCFQNGQLYYVLMSYVASLGETAFAPENFRSVFDFSDCERKDAAATTDQ